MRGSVVTQCAPQGWHAEIAIICDVTVTTLTKTEIGCCPQALIVLEGGANIAAILLEMSNITFITVKSNRCNILIGEIRHNLSESVLEEFHDALCCKLEATDAQNIVCGLWSTKASSMLEVQACSPTSWCNVEWLGTSWHSLHNTLFAAWPIPRKSCCFVSSAGFQAEVLNVLMQKTGLKFEVAVSPLSFPSFAVKVELRQMVFQYPRLGATHFLVTVMTCGIPEWKPRFLPNVLARAHQDLTPYVRVGGVIVIPLRATTIYGCGNTCHFDGVSVASYFDSRSVQEYCEFIKFEVASQKLRRPATPAISKRGEELTMTFSEELPSSFVMNQLGVGMLCCCRKPKHLTGAPFEVFVHG